MRSRPLFRRLEKIKLPVPEGTEKDPLEELLRRQNIDQLRRLRDIFSSHANDKQEYSDAMIREIEEVFATPEIVHPDSVRPGRSVKRIAPKI